MKRVMEYAPPALEVLGICLLWTLKGAAMAVGLALLVAWSIMRMMLAMLLFGRLPRSYVRVFD
jgi:hypothetical protein